MAFFWFLLGFWSFGFCSRLFFSQAEITPGPKKDHRFVVRRQDTTRRAPQRAQAAACSDFVLLKTFRLDHVTLYYIILLSSSLCLVRNVDHHHHHHLWWTSVPPTKKKVLILLKNSNILMYPIISKPGEHHHQHYYLCVCISYPTQALPQRVLLLHCQQKTTRGSHQKTQGQIMWSRPQGWWVHGQPSPSKYSKAKAG